MASKYPQLNNREWLYKKYWERGLSEYQIAEIVGCVRSTVGRHMNKLGITKRTDSESRKECPKLSREFLYQKYWKEGLLLRQIAETVGYGTVTIMNQMVALGIRRRTSSEARKGKRHPWYGKHLPEGTRKKISEAVKGEKNPNYGKHISEETKRKMREAHKGKHDGRKSPHWKGGYFPYYGSNWYSQRRKALKRDGYTCQKCGVLCSYDGKENSVHHIMPQRKYLEFIVDCYDFIGNIRDMSIVGHDVLVPNIIWGEMNRLDNLVTLCEDCHKKIGDETK